MITRIQELCRQLKPVLGTKIDRLWSAYLAESDASGKADIEQTLELLAAKHLGKDQPILVITDDTTGMTPGSTGQDIKTTATDASTGGPRRVRRRRTTRKATTCGKWRESTRKRSRTARYYFSNGISK